MFRCVARNVADKRDQERVQDREDHEHADNAPNAGRNCAVAHCEHPADEQRSGRRADDRRLVESMDGAGVEAARPRKEQ